MSLKDLKNKSPIYNWDDVVPFNVTDITTFPTPVLDSMTMTNAKDFVSTLGNYRTANVPTYNPESETSLFNSTTIKYGNNTYKGSKLDDAITLPDGGADGFNFDLNIEFNNKIKSLKKFGDIYNDDQTVKDTKRTNFGGTDGMNLATAAYNSGYRAPRIKGGNNDFKSEPYIITKTRKSNSGGMFDALVTQFEHGGRDLVRITKYLSSNSGLAHIAKQNLLALNARGNPWHTDATTSLSVSNVPPQTDELGIKSQQLLDAASRKLKFLPLTQKHKPIYSPLATLANTAAGVLGAQGARIIRFERDDFLSGGEGILKNLGGTNLNYSEYLNKESVDSLVYDDKLYYNGQGSHRMQNIDEDLSTSKNVNKSIDVTQRQVNRTQRGSGFGDFMTMMDLNTPGTNQVSLKEAYEDLGDMVESSQHGMPFYFYDMRTNQYIIFRGYLEGLTENIAPEWSPEKYVGRSEPVYSYTGAERDISFSLKLYAHSADELKMIYKKMNKLTSLCYPQYKVDSVLSDQSSFPERFTRMKPPLTKFRMGELYGQHKSNVLKLQKNEDGQEETVEVSEKRDLTGFIKSLAYSVPDESPWEIKKGKRVPKYITVAITYQVIHDTVPNSNTNFYGYVGD